MPLADLESAAEVAATKEWARATVITAVRSRLKEHWLRVGLVFIIMADSAP